MIRQRITRAFMSTIIFSLLLSACTIGKETWSLLKVSVQDSHAEVYEDYVEVRNCCNVVEKKTISCSAGTSSQLTVALGGTVGFMAGAELTIDPSVSTALGINKENGESLELEAPPPRQSYKYKVIKTFRVISGNATLRSSGGEEQSAPYTFQASCSLKLDSFTASVCDTSCPLNPSATVRFTDTPVATFAVNNPPVLTKTKTPRPIIIIGATNTPETIIIQPTNTSAPPTSVPQVSNPAPNPPTLLNPVNGASYAQSTEINLEWAGSGDSYTVELWGGPYTTMVPCDRTTATNCWIGQMWPGEMYWHVKTMNSDGQESGWSETASFTINP